MTLKLIIDTTKTILNYKKVQVKQVSLTGRILNRKKKRAVKDTVNIVAGGHLAIQLDGRNFGLPR
ncbi:hypothetical protein BpHYR1_041974 [Brachionus plicatilis]|uniref:Uncharacterized protein n=1 Tax=Brachionus plicatilis TaxID=10195 RepID=A0A3M7QC81_BRAPC|nr:hypothetical protein BpHYR1_041974 [Brachionus plicatilis]